MAGIAMIDIHSHILHGVDDGAESLAEAAGMVRAAGAAGVRFIIATPHYRDAALAPGQVARSLCELQESIADTGVTLLPGFEVMLDGLFSEEWLDGRVPTLGVSRFLLVEFPLNHIPQCSLDVLKRLQQKGLQPIMAHPERNYDFAATPELLARYVETGCLVQLDAGSITGGFGAKAGKLARKLLDRGWVHFVASDAHCRTDYSLHYTNAYRQVVEWIGQRKADSLFCGNAVPIIRAAG